MPAMLMNPPPVKSRTAVRRRAGRGHILAAVALAGAAAFLSACGSKSSTSTTSEEGKRLDTARVAASIEESVLKERNIHATVICPNTVVIEKGKSFECIATSKSPKAPHNTIKTPFIVTIQTNRGYVTYVGK
jgi:hypothetical protein